MNWTSSKNKNFALGKTWLNKNTSHRLGKKHLQSHIWQRTYKQKPRRTLKNLITRKNHEELLKI